MEIYFLDDEFSILDGPIDEITSAVVEERYFDVGSFTLRFPKSIFRRADEASYVLISDSGGEICGRVDYLSASYDDECEMGGGLLETLISDVIMQGGITYSGKLSDVIRSVLIDNLSHSGITVSAEMPPLFDEVTFMSDWTDLASFLYGVLRPYGASLRVVLKCGIPTVEIYTGRDLTSNSARDGGCAVFSASLGNITSLEYEKNTAEWKNYAYVVSGDGEVVTVDKSGGKTRREIIRKASDIRRENFLTEGEYVSALIRRGEEALSEYPEAVSVYAECDSGALPVYGVDYALGDICDAADDELGLSFALRVSSVSTVYEDGVRSHYPTFGHVVRYFHKSNASIL